AEVTVAENRRRSVLLVSRSPQAWQQALSAVPSVDLAVEDPADYHDTGADLVVLDGFVPAKLPAGQLLIVNPPPDNGLVKLRGEVRGVQIRSIDSGQPLLRALDLGGFRLVKASSLAVPSWAVSVADTPGGVV